MVLAARHRTIAMLPLALACACIEHSQPAPPTTRSPVSVVVANESSAPGFLASPPQLARSLTTALRAQGLEPTFADRSVFEGAMTQQRSTQARLRIVARDIGGSKTPDDIVLLVETYSRFYSELEGRFRWTVEVKASFARRGTVDKPAQLSFSAPAILLFPHEGGSQALTYVADPLAEQVGRLAREFIDEQVAR